MEDLIKILAASITIITFILTQFNSEQKRLDEMKIKYFEKVLVNYVGKHKGNPKMNSVKFIRRYFSIEDYYIPRYIFYLVDINDSESLNKILYHDYCEYMTNNENAMMNSITRSLLSIQYIIIYGGFFIIQLIVLSGIVNLANSVLNYLQRTSVSNLYLIITLAVFYLLFSFFTIKALIKFIRGIDDDYTLIKNKIIKIIKRKSVVYDKKVDRYYINHI